MKIDTEITVDPGKDSWIVVEIFGDWPSMAMTNAIYLDAAPYGKWGSSQWTFPEGAEKWFNPFPNTPNVTVPDGPSQSPIPLAEVNPGQYRKDY